MHAACCILHALCSTLQVSPCERVCKQQRNNETANPYDDDAVEHRAKACSMFWLGWFGFARLQFQSNTHRGTAGRPQETVSGELSGAVERAGLETKAFQGRECCCVRPLVRAAYDGPLLCQMDVPLFWRLCPALLHTLQPYLTRASQPP